MRVTDAPAPSEPTALDKRAASAPKPAGKPTINTVAQLAQVSRQTVSNVLRGQGRFSADVAQRVHEAVSLLGYQPNMAARQLRSRASNAIGFRLEEPAEEIGESVMDRFLHTLAVTARGQGYRLALYTVGRDADEIAEMDEALATLQLAGFVLYGTRFEDDRAQWLHSRNIPFVAFGRPWDSPDPHSVPYPWVDVRGDVGSHMAVQHLLDLGHRRIAFVGWPKGQGSGIGHERRMGWQQALKEAGLPADASVDVPDRVDQGADAFRRLSAGPQAPTAYICASDTLALGVLQASRAWVPGAPVASSPLAGAQTVGSLTAGALSAGVQTAGLPASEKPRDGAARLACHPVAVVGYDDTAVAQAVGLTSLRQPVRATATEVMASLLERIADPHSKARHVLLNPKLMIRDSTAACPANR